MRGRAVVLLLGVALAACGHGGSEPDPPAPATTAIPDGRAVTVGFPVDAVRRSLADGATAAARVLHEHGGRAGVHPVSLVFTDVHRAGIADEDPCGEAGRKLLAEHVVAAVIASGLCAREELRVLDVSGPPLLVGTTGAAGIASADPPVLRIGIADADEGEAAARYATTVLRRQRCIVLDDDTDAGRTLATRFTQAAGPIVVGRATWDAKAEGYGPLLRPLAALRPDCVYLAGIADQNGIRLIADAVAEFGPAGGAVRLLASSGFAGFAHAWTGAEQGLVLVTRQVPQGGLPGSAARLPSADDVPAQLAALEVILDAIGRSDGTRAGVARAALTGPPLATPVGRLSFDPATGEQLDPAAGVWQIRGDGERFLGTLRLG